VSKVAKAECRNPEGHSGFRSCKIYQTTLPICTKYCSQGTAVASRGSTIVGEFEFQTYSLGENTMLSCPSTIGAVTASTADAYAGPRARVCEIMGFDQGVFPLMSQDASTATTSADVKK